MINIWTCYVLVEGQKTSGIEAVKQRLAELDDPDYDFEEEMQEEMLEETQHTTDEYKTAPEGQEAPEPEEMVTEPTAL